MKKKILIKNKSALAGVIEALLLVALVAIILSIIQLVYIPEIMKEKEVDHVDVVENQFSNLKSVIEIQSLMGAMESDKPIAYSPMSSPITLGSKKLPYFISMGASGSIRITDTNDADIYKINIQPMSISKYSDGIPLTSIRYDAYNHYYLDGAPIYFVYEGGAIILNQSLKSEVMKVKPPISVENRSDDGYIKIYYVLPVFVGVEGKKDIGGSNDQYIRTNYTTHYVHQNQVASFIKILSKHRDLWYEYLTDSSDGLLREYIDNGYINVSVVNYEEINPDSPLCIKIEPDSLSVRVDLTVVEIGAQTGAGVITTG